jgi:hypothetical protein
MNNANMVAHEPMTLTFIFLTQQLTRIEPNLVLNKEVENITGR